MIYIININSDLKCYYHCYVSGSTITGVFGIPPNNTYVKTYQQHNFVVKEEDYGMTVFCIDIIKTDHRSQRIISNIVTIVRKQPNSDDRNSNNKGIMTLDENENKGDGTYENKFYLLVISETSTTVSVYFFFLKSQYFSIFFIYIHHCLILGTCTGYCSAFGLTCYKIRPIALRDNETFHNNF